MQSSRLEKQLPNSETIIFKAERHWVRYLKFVRKILRGLVYFIGTLCIIYFFQRIVVFVDETIVTLRSYASPEVAKYMPTLSEMAAHVPSRSEIIESMSISPEIAGYIPSLSEAAEYKYWLLIIPMYILLHGIFLYKRQKFLDSYDEMAVTQENIIRTHGFKNQTTSSLALQHVEFVNVSQTLLGRFFEYGNISIRSQGNSVYASFDKVKNPIGFRNSVIAAKERAGS